MARNLPRRFCRSSRSTARGGSRSARTTATPRTSPTPGTSTGWSARPSHSGSRPEDALLMASHHPALWHGLVATRRDRARLRRRPAPPSRPRELRADDGAEARPPARGRAAGRDPGLGAAVGSHRSAESGDFAVSVERGEAAGDRPRRGSGRDRVASSASPRSSTATRSRTRSATSRRSRSSSGTSRRAASGSGSSPAPACSSGALASSVAHDAHNLVVVGMSRRGHGRSPSSGSRSSAAGSSRSSPAASSPSARSRSRGSSPTRRSRTWSRRAARATTRRTRSAGRARPRS